MIIGYCTSSFDTKDTHHGINTNRFRVSAVGIPGYLYVIGEIRDFGIL